MKTLTRKDLTPEEVKLLDTAYTAAQRSLSPRGHKVGAVILCSDGTVYQGATLARTRIVGSTCAERMALDQLYFIGKGKPKLLVLVGLMVRPTWTTQDICTPCGVCLEMLWEMVVEFGLDDFDIIASSWDQTRIVRTSLFKLYPRLDKYAGRRKWTKGTFQA